MCVIDVCTTCKDQCVTRSASQRASPDAILVGVKRLVAGGGKSSRAPIAVRSQKCLGHCGGARIAVSGPNKWSWSFGSIDLEEDFSALREFLNEWEASADGLVPKAARPKSLVPKMLGRTPPLPAPREEVPYEAINDFSFDGAIEAASEFGT